VFVPILEGFDAAAGPGLKVGNHQADVGAKLIERHRRPGKYQRNPVEWLLPLPPALSQVGIHCVEGKYYIMPGRSFRNANQAVTVMGQAIALRPSGERPNGRCRETLGE
jgi:hypothetical protein